MNDLELKDLQDFKIKSLRQALINSTEIIKVIIEGSDKLRVKKHGENFLKLMDKVLKETK